MPYSIEQYPELPAIVITQSGSQFMKEMSPAGAELVRLLDSQPGPVDVIMDARGLTLTMDELMAVAVLAPRGPHGWAAHHHARAFTVITSDQLIRLSAESMDDFGKAHKRVTVCETLEQAFDLCAEGAGQPEMVAAGAAA